MFAKSRELARAVSRADAILVASRCLVGNRAQRCDCHKLAEVWWEGGMRSNVQISCLSPFLDKNVLREI